MNNGRLGMQEGVLMPTEMAINRLALMSRLTSTHPLGRTAIMKLLFFLQEFKGIALDYQFSLYSYGPFDSEVLADIATGERIGVVKSTPVFYNSGHGFQYSRDAKAERLEEIANEFLQQYSEEIDWCLQCFGAKSASELELLSTLFFVAKFHKLKDVDQLIEQVKLIKPHFSKEQIRSGFNELVGFNVLRVAA